MQQPRQNWAYDFCCKLFSCNGSASTGKIASGFNLPLAAQPHAASGLNLVHTHKLARCKWIFCKCPYTDSLILSCCLLRNFGNRQSHRELSQFEQISVLLFAHERWSDEPFHNVCSENDFENKSSFSLLRVKFRTGRFLTSFISTFETIGPVGSEIFQQNRHFEVSLRRLLLT